MKHLLLMSLLFVSCGQTQPSEVSHEGPLIPASFTTGSLCSLDDPDFDGVRYSEQLPHCGRNVSLSLKKVVYESYGLGYNPDKAYTIDHLIPLSLGGSNHQDNLWPQHKSLHTGDMEYKLFCLLRDGEIRQADAVTRLLDVKFGRAPLSIPFASNCDTYAFGGVYAD